MPNAFAYFVLFFWPVVVFALFRKLPLSLALSWAIVAGYLLLPLRTGFNLPMFPTVDRNFVLSVAAAVMCYVALRWARDSQRVAARRGGDGAAGPGGQEVAPDKFNPVRGNALFLGLVILLFASPFLTVAQNGDTIVIGTRVLNGLRSYDALAVNGALLVTVLPFFLGRRFLAGEEGQKNLLKVLVLAAAAYSIFILYEVRMSPQLNRMVYGFFPHSFAQHVRAGGFRPLVFLNHGLWLAIFMALCVLASFVLWRQGGQADRSKWLVAGVWLFVMLMLCKSLGAFALTLLFLPVILFSGRRTQLLIAGLMAGAVLIYPALRGAGWIPVDRIHEVAASINEDRAGSLNTRLVNEDQLLARAQERPLAGWGGWGRSRVYNERGGDITITDGFWIIVVGTYGWLGYVAQFGLLCLPLILTALRRNRLQMSLVSSGVGILLAVSLIDQIPNATIGPVVWLMAGSVLGRYQTARVATKNRQVRSGDLPEPDMPAMPASPIRDSGTRRGDHPPRHQRRPRTPV